MAYEVLRRAVLGQPLYWGDVGAFTQRQKERILSPRLRRIFTGRTSWEAIQPIRRRFEILAWEKSDLNWMSYLDLNFRLPELLLMRVDKMSMGVSLEGRVPFLDRKFVELAMSIPAALKTRNGTLKHILKKAVRGLIPDEIIDRQKQGFSVPVFEWLFDKLGNRARQVLEKFCDQTDFLDKREVMRLVDTGNSAQIWCLLNFAMWWNEYISEAGKLV
jgi:asparagine synthase (glutamine-hydrolysing)